MCEHIYRYVGINRHRSLRSPCLKSHACVEYIPHVGTCPEYERMEPWAILREDNAETKTKRFENDALHIITCAPNILQFISKHINHQSVI